MLKPTLKRRAELTEQDFAEHPAWTAWYSPDEMEALVSLGFDEVETTRALQSIGWSDEYAFPLPEAGAAVPFMRLCVSARVTTKGDHCLQGYLAPAAVTVFYRGKRYAFNRALRDMSIRQAKELAAVLGEDDVFPLQIHLPALKRIQEFDLRDR